MATPRRPKRQSTTSGRTKAAEGEGRGTASGGRSAGGTKSRTTTAASADGGRSTSGRKTRANAASAAGTTDRVRVGS